MDFIRIITILTLIKKIGKGGIPERDKITILIWTRLVFLSIHLKRKYNLKE